MLLSTCLRCSFAHLLHRKRVRKVRVRIPPFQESIDRLIMGGTNKGRSNQRTTKHKVDSISAHLKLNENSQALQALNIPSKDLLTCFPAKTNAKFTLLNEVAKANKDYNIRVTNRGTTVTNRSVLKVTGKRSYDIKINF